MTLEEYEDHLRPKLRYPGISSIPGFPFPAFADLRQGIASGQWGTGIDYTLANHLAASVYGGTWAAITLVLSNFPFLLCVILVVAALITKWWLLLWGVPLALFGFFTATPYNPARKGFSLFAILLLGLTAWLITRGSVALALAVAAFPLSFGVIRYLYSVNQDRLRYWAESSEVVFVALFEDAKLGLVHRPTSKQIWIGDLVEAPQSP